MNGVQETLLSQTREEALSLYSNLYFQCRIQKKRISLQAPLV